MIHTRYTNGMYMIVDRYEYEYEQTLVLDNDLIKYDMLEIESDTNSNPFGIYFTYYFYYMKGKLVKTQIG